MRVRAAARKRDVLLGMYPVSYHATMSASGYDAQVNYVRVAPIARHKRERVAAGRGEAPTAAEPSH